MKYLNINRACEFLKGEMDKFILTIIFSIFLFIVGISYAGEIDEAVYRAIGKRHEKDKISVIVRMSEQPNLSKITKSLKGTSKKVKSTTCIKYLKNLASRNQRDIKTYLKKEISLGNIEKYTPFWIFNGFAIKATPKVILAIAKRSDVKRVSEDGYIPLPDYKVGKAMPSVSSVEWNITKIKAPEVWELGIGGSGAVVGIFDTGVDYTHPDLAEKYRGGDNSWFDPYGEHDQPHDAVGHGTHVAGTILGGSNGGTSIGVAPGAKWIAAKAWDDYGFSTASAFHLIFEWFMDPDGDPETDDAPDVVNNSWGYALPICFKEFEADVQAWRSAGIFPVFSAGNGGNLPFTAISPANYPETLSVGATDINNVIAEFSSRGPSLCDFSIFPDVCAPGVDINSAEPGRHYVSYSGTSMACPHVVGTVALMLSANPELTLDEIEQILKDTALPLGILTPNNNYGWGLINAYEAVMSVM